MEFKSAEVVLWFVPREGWCWEMNVNGKFAAKSVYTDQKSAREIARWVANSLDVDFREATHDEIEERTRDEREREREARAARTVGLGLVDPRKPKDLIDFFHESESPPTDQ